MRLSSDNLYHFTRSIENVKRILVEGFRYSLLKEEIPSDSFKRALFAVCFCDIRIDENYEHRSCYGNSAIVLSKEWGIRNGITPVRYIHQNSPGATKDYLKIRNYYKNMRDLSRILPDNFEFDLVYLFLSIMHIEKKLKANTLYEELETNRTNFIDNYNKLEKDFAEFYDDLKEKNAGYALKVSKYINALIYRITELHNELLERDFYLRRYSEDYKCPSNNTLIQGKILYDEREWRSLQIYTFTETDPLERVKEFDIYYNQGFLPPSFNLTFDNKDIVAILAENKRNKEELISFMKGNKTSLFNNDIDKKVHVIDEYRET